MSGQGGNQQWQAGYGQPASSGPAPINYPTSTGPNQYWGSQNQFGGSPQSQAGQPLWQNPFSPMNAGDWAALEDKYFPTADPLQSIVYAYQRGGESEMSDAIESHYGRTPNPAIFGSIAKFAQELMVPDFMLDTPAVRAAFAVTHPAYEGWQAEQEALAQAAAQHAAERAAAREQARRAAVARQEADRGALGTGGYADADEGGQAEGGFGAGGEGFGDNDGFGGGEGGAHGW